jgi:hypothetical protein
MLILLILKLPHLDNQQILLKEQLVGCVNLYDQLLMLF